MLAVMTRPTLPTEAVLAHEDGRQSPVAAVGYELEAVPRAGEAPEMAQAPEGPRGGEDHEHPRAAASQLPGRAVVHAAAVDGVRVLEVGAQGHRQWPLQDRLVDHRVPGTGPIVDEPGDVAIGRSPVVLVQAPD